jgi:hypothetical protein
MESVEAEQDVRHACDAIRRVGSEERLNEAAQSGAQMRSIREDDFFRDAAPDESAGVRQ